ncbi:outer membrane protein assembly factor BamA [Pelagibacterales bacterium SAG-MED01]|nr:outer membrane protein assembly factor BamA [Pelagibacterales bacterium SAG-MED01]
MSKIILHIFLFLFFNNAFAEVIKDVDVSGNKRISDETVLVLGELSIGQNFETTDLNNSLKKLYESNFFKDIQISINNGILNVKLVENPIIEDIEIVGIKSKTFTADILDNIKLKNRMSFTEDLLKKDIDLIKNILKTNGFYFAEVTSSFIKNDDLNSIRIKYNIDRGNKARIKQILFIGDKKIKDRKLIEVIASEEHKFWKFVSNKVYLNQSLINLDKRLLENYYRNLGYYKVNIINSFAELSDEGSFKLTFNIDAGEKYFFNDFKLSIPDDYNKSDFTKVDKIFEKLKDERYSLDSINLILEEIDKIASSRLYDFIDAEVKESIQDKNKINFEFKVIDSDKFYVERVNILGNFQTIEEVIRNRLIVDEGDPLNELLYNKSIDNIRSLGIFKSVKSKIKDGSDPNLKIIDLTVEEKPTGEISLAAGVGTGGSTIGGGVVEKNFLGKGINLATNLEISESAVKGQFVYSKPNFNYTDNTLFTSVKSTTTDNLSDFGYKVSNAGFALGTKFEQYENLFFSPEIDISVEDLKTNSSASNSLKKQEGTYEDFYFNYGLDYDLRNSSFRPSSGNKTSFFQELPIVSGNNEISNTFVFTQYKTLNKASEMIGKASIYFEAINSMDNSDVRISKRAQMPYNRLRGFEKGKVGPVDNSDFVGGNYVTAMNFSTNLPGILNTVENIDFSYFIDLGNVWGVDYDSSIDDSNVIRSSTGIGLDWITPIGPLSFSLTQPMTKKSSDKTETFRFNLGTTF